MKSLFLSLILVCASNETIPAHELRVNTAAEDILGRDERELRIFADGALKETLRKDMTRGQAWDIAWTHSFTSVINDELWDQDSPDADDHLGTLHVVPSQPSALKASARFSRDGAAYELSYFIRVAQSGSPKVKATIALRAFSDDPRPGVFTAIDKRKLFADLKKRIEDPALISPSGESLCGPSAVLYLLVKNDPERYVELARDLYSDGQYRMDDGKTMKLGRRLRTGAEPKGISPADWMLAASLRDASNLASDFDPGDRLSGITLPGEIGERMKDLLGCGRIEVDTIFLYGEKKELEAARDAVASGNVAVLLVNTGYLPGRKTGSVNLADHWIVLLSVSASVNRTIFKIWSWGKEYDLNMSVEEFKHFMWGTVIGYY
ncbi:MAG: hypothetical protein JXD23_09865 [Spirochaetales bacterium]|nr:hypothetical protein [Spirochaetales bacterium]